TLLRADQPRVRDNFCIPGNSRRDGRAAPPAPPRPPAHSQFCRLREATQATSAPEEIGPSSASDLKTYAARLENIVPLFRPAASPSFCFSARLRTSLEN